MKKYKVYLRELFSFLCHLWKSRVTMRWIEKVWPCKQAGAKRKVQVLLNCFPWSKCVLLPYALSLFWKMSTQHSVCALTCNMSRHTVLNFFNKLGWHRRQSGLPMPPCPFCWTWKSPTGWAVNSSTPQNLQAHTRNHTT